jgi:hypothetical protein
MLSPIGPATTLKKFPNLKQDMCFGFYLLLDSLLACKVEIMDITLDYIEKPLR